MKTESKFVQGKRVRHANAVSSHVTPSNFPSASTDLEKLNANDLKGLRHDVEQGIGNGVVADSQIQEYFRFLDKIDGAIEKRNTRAVELQRRAQGAPSINTVGLGDNTGNLSKRFSIS